MALEFGSFSLQDVCDLQKDVTPMEKRGGFSPRGGTMKGKNWKLPIRRLQGDEESLWSHYSLKIIIKPIKTI